MYGQWSKKMHQKLSRVFREGEKFIGNGASQNSIGEESIENYEQNTVLVKKSWGTYLFQQKNPVACTLKRVMGLKLFLAFQQTLGGDFSDCLYDGPETFETFQSKFTHFSHFRRSLIFLYL